MLSAEDVWRLKLGARALENGETKFLVWAPNLPKLDLILVAFDGEKNESLVEMQKEREEEEYGYYSATVQGAGRGTRYFYSFERRGERIRRADPVSRYQPGGVHGPSEVVDPAAFRWSDQDWKGVGTEDLLIYELHVGTFTERGTFDSIIPYIDYLKDDLGIGAIELMPVAQFPGSRNWGYDGVFLFAPQDSYGGPESLKKLVDSCHSRGLAVILDVVYNHLGPEGNYLSDYGPYFSNKFHTPWGPSVNYDDRGCDGVRRFVTSNALYWITEYHFDGLRLDAIHGIFDNSPKNILEEIKDRVEEQAQILKRKVSVIAESDLNDPRIVLPKEKCGYGLDSQWSDDYHHSIHAFLTGEKSSYYVDYGRVEDIAKALAYGFVYDGRYSKFRERRHGASCEYLSGDKFVVCLQNHDQVGNRPDGLRLSAILDKAIDKLKIAAALLLQSPYVPLLFMGEEYGEDAPFFYFTSHTDPKLVEAVKEGRKREFESHNWGQFYVDPQDEETFRKSKINLERRFSSPFHQGLLDYYRELIRLRKANPALRSLERNNLVVKCDPNKKVIVVRRFAVRGQELILAYNLNRDRVAIGEDMIEKQGTWRKIHDSSVPSPTPENPTGAFVLPPFTFAIYTKS